MFYHRHQLNNLSLDEFIDVSEEILKIENPLHIDEHLRPQSASFSPDEVDHIVPIQSLERFLIDELGCVGLPHDNKVTAEKVRPNAQQTEKIQALYSADYLILPTYPG